MPSTTSDVSFASTTANNYELSFSLQGHTKAVNSLAFNHQGTLLASGGDDEEVRIWDIKTQKCIQQLIDNRWGQITVIKFVDLDMNRMGNDHLFFGTGRGRLAVYRQDRKTGTFIHVGKWKMFGPCESVEAFAVEPHSRLVAASSQHGTVQLSRFDGQTMQTLWCESDLGVIPRSLLFFDRGKSVMIFGMESGTIWCRDCETSQTTSIRHLRTPIGEVDFCAASNQILVDNMRDGFDLYPIHKTTPRQTFMVKNTKKFIKAACFAEKGKMVVCGSDHGCAYVFSSSNTTKEQILKHGGDSQIIQTAATISTKSGHVIATTASTEDFAIKIWKKNVIRPKEPKKPQGFDKKSMLNAILIVLLAVFSKDTWLPPLQAHYAQVKTKALGRWIEPLKTVPTTETIVSPIDVAEIIHSLDDDAVRKLFKMEPKLTEQELQVLQREWEA